MKRRLENKYEPHISLRVDLPQQQNYVSTLLVLLTASLIMIGTLLVYSASNGTIQSYFIKHVTTICIFSVAAFFVSHFDIQFLYRVSYPIYFLSIGFLILAKIVGVTAMGAQRWLNVGMINIQPSEIMKISLILALARYFTNTYSEEMQHNKFLLVPLALILLPFIIILKQPNLGTAIIVLCIGGAILFAVGVRIRLFLIVLIITLGSLPIIWHSLHQYQKQRVLTFLNPSEDLLGSGYNIVQSEIAIGSGGFIGKGLLSGTQGQLKFLPEKHTDFIFSLLAEEFGFLGVVVVLLLYCGVISLSYIAALDSQSYYGKILCIGISSMLFLHIIINLSMISGLMPVVGVTLPMISYGCSNLSITILSIGLVLCVNRHSSFRF